MQGNALTKADAKSTSLRELKKDVERANFVFGPLNVEVDKLVK